MLTRALVGMLLAASVLGGCKGELNAAYCAEHLDDEDCRNAGLVRVDAPAPECVANADCTGNPRGSVCDTARNMCVQCIDDVDETACSSQMMVCGTDQTCHGCIVDSDCETTSMVCLPSQSCAMESGVLYTAPTEVGPDCTKAAPCAVATAVGKLSPERHIIKLTTTVNGVDYVGGAIEINTPAFGVQIIATGTTYKSTDAGKPVLTAAGQNLEVLAMTIVDPLDTGIVCTGGTLTLRRVSVTGSPQWGLDTTGCTLTVERSRFSANKLGGMQITSGKAEIRNNILDRNGTSGSSGTVDGAIHVVSAEGRIAFNTIALNLSRGGGSDRVGGIKCIAAAAGFFIVRNIVVDNGNLNIFGASCASVGNYTSNDADTVNFLNTNDFKLTAQSPDVSVLNDPAATDDCKVNGVYIDDFHSSQLRPQTNFCDVGADEYEP